MQFRKHLPTLAWLLGLATCRRARLIWLALASAILFATIVLHAYFAFVAYRIRNTIDALAKVQLDRTSRDELLRLLPALGLEPVNLRPSPECRSGECYSATPYDWQATVEYRPSFRLESKLVYQLEYALGLRYLGFSIWAKMQNGLVHSIGYDLLVDNGSGTYPGLVFVNVRSIRSYRRRGLSAVIDESPDYQAKSRNKFRELNLEVSFTPAAPPELIHRAFDVNLDCVGILQQCEAAKNILPDAWNDIEAIESAARTRVRGPDPCPESILPRRARDMDDILRVRVEKVTPGGASLGLSDYLMVDYKLLEILKGGVNRPLKGSRHPLALDGPYSQSDAPNPDIKLLRPGAELLLFWSEYIDDDSPCQIVPASPKALQIIRAELASPSAHVPDSFDSRW